MLLLPRLLLAAPLANFSQKLDPISRAQERLHPWASRDFPNPSNEFDLERCGLNVETMLNLSNPILLCDPEEILHSGNAGDQHWHVLERTLLAFNEQFSQSIFGAAWGVRLGVAMLSEAAEESLAAFADVLAQRWKLSGIYIYIYIYIYL